MPKRVMNSDVTIQRLLPHGPCATCSNIGQGYFHLAAYTSCCKGLRILRCGLGR
jgi:hypothetical protein